MKKSSYTHRIDKNKVIVGHGHRKVPIEDWETQALGTPAGPRHHNSARPSLG
jgi:hypothetical protein